MANGGSLNKLLFWFPGGVEFGLSANLDLFQPQRVDGWFRRARGEVGIGNIGNRGRVGSGSHLATGRKYGVWRWSRNKAPEVRGGGGLKGSWNFGFDRVRRPQKSFKPQWVIRSRARRRIKSKCVIGNDGRL